MSSSAPRSNRHLTTWTLLFSILTFRLVGLNLLNKLKITTRTQFPSLRKNGDSRHSSSWLFVETNEMKLRIKVTH